MIAGSMDFPVANRSFLRSVGVVRKNWNLMMAAMLSVGTLGATSLVEMSFDEQVEESAEIFRGKVTEKAAEWRESNRGLVIYTKVTFDVLDQYKGTAEASVTLEFLGGTIGDESMVVEGIPEFRVGEELVLFVSGDQNRACPVIGWSRGKFEVARDAGGGGVVELSAESQVAASIARTRRIMRPDDRMALGEFEQMLRQRVATLEAGK